MSRQQQILERRRERETVAAARALIEKILKGQLNVLIEQELAVEGKIQVNPEWRATQRIEKYKREQLERQAAALADKGEVKVLCADFDRAGGRQLGQVKKASTKQKGDKGKDKGNTGKGKGKALICPARAATTPAGVGEPPLPKRLEWRGPPPKPAAEPAAPAVRGKSSSLRAEAAVFTPMHLTHTITAAPAPAADLAAPAAEPCRTVVRGKGPPLSAEATVFMPMQLTHTTAAQTVPARPTEESEEFLIGPEWLEYVPEWLDEEHVPEYVPEWLHEEYVPEYAVNCRHFTPNA